MKKVKIIDGDYWVEIQIGGKKWRDGHTLDQHIKDLFEELGLDVEWVDVDNSYWEEENET